MAMPFEVFAKQYLLTWDHLQNPYTIRREREIKPEQKTQAVVGTLIAAGVAAGACLVLDRSRTTLLVIAGGTALVTFYAVTGYFKWCLTQPPADGRKGPPRETVVERRTTSRTSSSTRQVGFATPGSPHTLEDFRQKPDWLVPQRTSGGSFVESASSLRRENERKYFASLWKKIYEGGLAVSTLHWTDYSHLDEKLRNNTFEVLEGAPWEEFARFAQKHIQ